jgi:hypothetical protein
MKKHISLFVLLLIVAMAAVATAGTMLIKDKSKLQTPIQNLKGAAAIPAQSRCDTAADGTAAFKTYTAAGYIGIKAGAFNYSTGAPEVVKWYEDAKQVWIGTEYESVNKDGTAISTIKGQAFTNNTTSFCVRRH